VAINDVPREEVMQVVRKVFGSGGPRDREQALRDVSQALGYARLGSSIRKTLETDLLTAVKRGILENERGQLRLLARSLADYDRNFLKQQFLAAMGRGWVEREEAIYRWVRWLGYGRTTEGMFDIGRSLINGLVRTGELEVEGRVRVRRV
jgi:hypothetical protein